MSTVRFEISASLDGYTTASDPTLVEPMGPGGQILHHHWSADTVSKRLLAESQAGVGASLAGRRTYDRSIEWWQADGPGDELRTPTFIVSHSVPDDVPEGGVYTFVGSAEEALDQALDVAGDKDVDVFSSSVGAQLLRAGRVDEVHVHLVPVLLGAGTRLVDDLGGRPVRLEQLDSVQSPNATHLRYGVIRD